MAQGLERSQRLRTFSDGGLRQGHAACGRVLLTSCATNVWGHPVWTCAARGSIYLGARTITFAELVGACEVTKAALSLVTVGSISYDSDFKVKYSQVRGPTDAATLRGLLTSRWS